MSKFLGKHEVTIVQEYTDFQLIRVRYYTGEEVVVDMKALTDEPDLKPAIPLEWFNKK